MKFKILISLILTLAATVFIFDACKKNEGSKPYAPSYLKFTVPAGWPQPPTDIFKDNPLTEEGFQLGRKLFYDGKLSKDGNFPCASCHQQFAAFSTYDHQFSHGFDNAFTFRNAPALFNLAWMKEMHWDGGVNHIEVQPLAPITNITEMVETIDNVLKKLVIDTAYTRMFTAAFGDNTINSQRMLKALSQFMGSIQSFNSKYDQVKRGTASFTVAEQNGYNIFKAKCNSCHAEPLFTDNSFRNNGLTLDAYLQDKGRMRITGNTADSLKFKVPSLRNIRYTPPYMHDGRLLSLQQAIEHYRTGIVVNQSTLDPLLKNRISMTNQEKVDLVEFLSSLSDNDLLQNTRFAQPN
ncbi:MAG: cytochrome-c peroxidase [Ferruginibacter sp.]|nr:cytochrome-c peroxidase [Ferruginibacter sp.]